MGSMRYSIPEGYTKSELFARPTPAGLKNRRVIGGAQTLESMAGRIASLRPCESYCITGDLLDGDSARYCRKHDPALDITPTTSGPAGILNVAFMCGIPAETTRYSWRADGADQRLRVVPFVKLLEGARLFAYESKKMPDGAQSNVQLYSGAAVVALSRRTTHEKQHTITLSGIATSYGDSWRDVSASSCCKDNLYTNLHDGDQAIFCSHQIAAYWKAGAAAAEEGNRVPMGRHNPFPVPSQALVDFYKKLSGQTFVAERKGGKQRYRLANEPEMGRLLVTYMNRMSSSPFQMAGNPASLRWG